MLPTSSTQTKLETSTTPGWVHFNFADVSRVGEVEVHGVEERLFAQAWFQLFERIVVRYISSEGYLGDVHRLVASSNGEVSVLKLDIDFGCLHQVGGYLLAFGNDFVGGFNDSATAD